MSMQLEVFNNLELDQEFLHLMCRVKHFSNILVCFSPYLFHTWVTVSLMLTRSCRTLVFNHDMNIVLFFCFLSTLLEIANFQLSVLC